MSATPQNCPTSWSLERYHFGYLAAAERRQLDQHLDHCSACQAWLQDLEHESLPPLQWSSPLPAATAQEPSFWETWWAAVRGWARPLAFAGAGALALAFFTWQSPQHTGLQPDASPTPRPKASPAPHRRQASRPKARGFRTKGSHTWQIFAQRAHSKRVVRVRAGHEIHTRDALRFHFDLEHALYVMVVSINERGSISLYYPYPSPKALALEGGAHRLPKKSAIPLDQYVGGELFVMVSSRKPFGYSKVKRALSVRYRSSQGKLDQIQELSGFGWQRRILLQKVR